MASAPSPVLLEENASDDEEMLKLQEIQQKILRSVLSSSRSQLMAILTSTSPDTILRSLLSFTDANANHKYRHDKELQSEARVLLGNSCSDLNLIQIACFLGEEELALDLIEFVAMEADLLETRKILLELLGRVWGNGNTLLHLASFHGMADLVRRLLELGASTNKKNELGYKPVDCADDEQTRRLFQEIYHGILIIIFRLIYYPCIVIRMPSNGLRRSRSAEALTGSLIKQGSGSKHQRSSSKSKDEDSRLLLSVFTPALHRPIETFPDKLSPIIGPISISRSRILTLPQLPLSNAGYETANRTTLKMISAIRQQSKSKKVYFDPKSLFLNALREGDLNLVQSLLWKDLDLLDVRTPHSELNAIHLCAGYNHPELINFLLSALKGTAKEETLVREHDVDGWTAIRYAAVQGFGRVFEILGLIYKERGWNIAKDLFLDDKNDVEEGNGDDSVRWWNSSQIMPLIKRFNLLLPWESISDKFDVDKPVLKNGNHQTSVYV